MKSERGRPSTYLIHAVPPELAAFSDEVLELAQIERIEHQAKEYFAHHHFDVADFPESEDSYTRTILCRKPNGFEAMMARWSPGTVSAIHGHPAYGLYLLLHGQLQVENFEKRNGHLVQVSSQVWNPGSCCLIQGQEGAFDNGIHRIRVLQESLSFHVYSDNALKGECFDAA